MKSNDLISLADKLIRRAQFDRSFSDGLTKIQANDFDKFITWLNRKMKFLNSMEISDGEKIAVITRAAFMWGFDMGLNIDLRDGELFYRGDDSLEDGSDYILKKPDVLMIEGEKL